MAESIKIAGAAEALRLLRRLPVELQEKALQGAVRAGAKVVYDAAKALAPEDTGRLKRNIFLANGRKSDVDAATLIGVRSPNAKQTARFKRRTGLPASANPRDAFYWRFLEFGTSKMRARPFMRPAFDQNKEAAANTIITALRAGIETAFRKLVRR